MAPPHPLPSRPVMLARGATKRCARCGQGRLFRRWLSMLERCPRCWLRFEREEGGFLGSVAINIGVTELIFGIFLVLGFVLTYPDPPVAHLVVAGLVLNAVVPIVFAPFSKTIWVAVELCLRSWQAEDIADIER